MNKNYRSTMFRWMPWLTFAVYLIFCFFSWASFIDAIQFFERKNPMLSDSDSSHRIAAFAVMGGVALFFRAVELSIAWWHFHGDKKSSSKASQSPFGHAKKTAAMSLIWGIGAAAIVIFDPTASFHPLRSLRHFIVFALPVYVAVGGIVQAVFYLLLIFSRMTKGRSFR